MILILVYTTDLHEGGVVKELAAQLLESDLQDRQPHQLDSCAVPVLLTPLTVFIM